MFGKKFIVLVSTFMFVLFGVLCSLVFSSPFLVCDPQTNVTHYVIIIDGNEHVVEAQDLGDGTVRLYYDLGGFSEGSHTIQVKAKNLWGVSEPVPFEFTKSLPPTPTGLSLSAE